MSTLTLSNWARTFFFSPKSIEYPSSEEEIITLVKKAYNEKRRIRTIGTGHSWTKMIESKDILVSLDKYQGVVDVDQENMTATVLSGTKLKRLGEELFQFGMGQENLGDIDVQSIAGASSTGTHGTGLKLRSISNQIIELEMINGLGEKVVMSEALDSDLFNAARLSLGAFGIITKIKLKLNPKYKLKVETKPMLVEDMLSSRFDLLKDNRHFEVFYFPHAPKCLVKKMNITNEEVDDSKINSYLNDKLLENDLFGLLNKIAAKSKRYKLLRKIMNACLSSSSKTNWAHKIFATERSVKFYEMEYGIPLNHFEDCFFEMRESIEKNNFQTLFPIEIRFVKEDELWLSASFERDVVYFAIHMHIDETPTQYFAAMEDIFRKYGGKPHPGKMNNLNFDYLEANYSRFQDFLKLRSTLDPEMIFINDYLKELFRL